MTAGLYAARGGASVTLYEELFPGGQIAKTPLVENYPGFADPIDGTWLVEQMQAQAERVGARIVYDHVVAVDASRRPFRLTGDSGNTYAIGSTAYFGRAAASGPIPAAAASTCTGSTTLWSALLTSAP